MEPLTSLHPPTTNGSVNTLMLPGNWETRPCISARSTTNLPINGGTHTGGADPTIYSGYRWFEGIDSNLNGGTSEVNDPAKLKCHTCNVQRELFWTGTQFSLVVPGATSTNKNNENLWAECN